jgi:hypothetical protein
MASTGVTSAGMTNMLKVFAGQLCDDAAKTFTKVWYSEIVHAIHSPAEGGALREGSPQEILRPILLRVL